MSNIDSLIFCFRIVMILSALGLGAAIAIVFIATACRLVRLVKR